jgi:hypothetical protein
MRKDPSGFPKPEGSLYQKGPNHRNSGSALFAWQQWIDLTGKGLPRLSLEQVRAALRYYAEYPDEIDQILAEGEAEAVKARLYRSLGPAG